jgi:hypothetical protein
MPLMYMLRTSRSLLCLGLSLVMAACGDAPPTVPDPPPVDPSQVYGIIVGIAAPAPRFILTGMQLQMFAQANDVNQTALPIPITQYQWSSTNPAVAEVDQQGRVTVKAVGVTVIVAQVGGKAGGQGIPVGVPSDFYLIDPDTSQMLPGQVRALRVDDAIPGQVRVAYNSLVIHSGWTSSNPAVAMVDSNGVVTALAAGKTTLSVVYPLDYPRTEPIVLRGEITVQPLSAPLRFTQLATGASVTCGLATDGEAWCWGTTRGAEPGSNPLGTTARVDRCFSVSSTMSREGSTFYRTISQCAMEPTRVATPLRFASITAVGGAPCGVTGDGQASCWGDVGALSASTMGTATPVPVSATLRFASFTFPCGVTLTNEGWCWGPDATSGAVAPAGAVSQVAGGAVWQSITGGTGSFRCGLTTSGSVRCWGSNSSGQLGTGDSVSSPVPVPIRSTEQFAAVVAGASGACALSATKALYCWGPGRPLPTLSNSTLRFTSISGLAGQLCAIDTDGIGYCGSASGLTSLSPTLRFKSLASGAGFEDRCGIAEDGYAYCSGNNDAGETGTGALGIYLHDTYFPDMRRVVGQ